MGAAARAGPRTARPPAPGCAGSRASSCRRRPARRRRQTTASVPAVSTRSAVHSSRRCARNRPITSAIPAATAMASRIRARSVRGPPACPASTSEASARKPKVAYHSVSGVRRPARPSRWSGPPAGGPDETRRAQPQRGPRGEATASRAPTSTTAAKTRPLTRFCLKPGAIAPQIPASSASHADSRRRAVTVQSALISTNGMPSSSPLIATTSITGFTSRAATTTAVQAAARRPRSRGRPSPPPAPARRTTARRQPGAAPAGPASRHP